MIVSSYIPDADPSSGFSCRDTFCKAVASYFYPKTKFYHPCEVLYDPLQWLRLVYLRFGSSSREDAIARTAYALFATDYYILAHKHSA